jgi:hypothetical protein
VNQEGERMNGMPRQGWWRRGSGTGAAVALLALALPLQAQEGRGERDRWDEDRWEDFADRMAYVMERAMSRAEWAAEHAAAQAEWATARALQALERVDWEREMEFITEGSWIRDLEALGEVDWDAPWDGEDRAPRSQEEFRWSGRIGAGDVLEIKGVNGPISARAATGDEIEVVATKTGRRSNPEEVRIDVIEHSGGVTLCAVYPTPRGKPDNECGVGSDGRNSTENNDVQVEWEVRVPRDVRFRGRTVNGDVEAMELARDVDVATVNGDVELATEGFAEARTVNGSIRARMAGDPSADVSFETVNGSIELDVDADLDADLDAAWLNGDLETDLPIQIQGRMGRRSAQGRLGAGGHRLMLKTVNGSIRIY